MPEVVQTSAMDCGPAALKSLLEGHGIPVSYGRLREACQTDLDGTSVDTLEEIAGRLGLSVEQVLLPADHLLLPEARALPALVVVRLPGGSTHFVVVWRTLAGIVEVMDPATGRRFLRTAQLLRELYQHVMPVPAAAWRQWAGSPEAVGALAHRLRDVGLPEAVIRERTREAQDDPGWRGLALLDAATRAVSSLVRSGGLRRGREAQGTLEALVADSRGAGSAADRVVPPGYWSVRESPADENGGEQLLFRGAVAVRVLGQAAEADVPEPHAADVAPLSPELEAARREAPSAPVREILDRLVAEGRPGLGALAAGLVGAAGVVVLEALLLRGLLELAPLLELSGQRLLALGALVGLLFVALLLELPIQLGLLRLGRRLEARVRIAFQEKIPRLTDRYFQSRLTSDMAERSHSLHSLRLIPRVGGQFTQAAFELLLTTAGIVWLAPAEAWLAGLAALLAFVVPLAFQPWMSERDMRVRSHGGGLFRFYLDALLGHSAVRAHGAQRPLRSQHESLLTEWARARLGLQRAALLAQATQALAGFGLAAALLLGHLRGGGEIGSVLLLVYWALRLPALGQVMAQGVWQYPSFRNITLRMMEPLGAPEADDRELPRVEGADGDGAAPARPESALEPGEGAGATIRMEGVAVVAAGHRILEGVDLDIEAGSHVAVVGSSGAGKTTLLGLLLGWHRPASGAVLVNGEPLRGVALRRLRAATAWVDPSVQLWNRGFLDNLRYGNGEGFVRPLAQVIELAELRSLLEALPQGHQTVLGEGGSLVSGGEGQRVRLGRALLRPGVRLALLDEPFRGLDRVQRSRLLARSREIWRGATLVCVTHDIDETRQFDRVLVVEGGMIVEDGAPEELSARAGSRYRRLLDAEEAVRGVWADAGFDFARLENGRIRATAPGARG